MMRNTTLVVSSVLSILFMSLHVADDIVRGMEPGGMGTLIGVLILVTWLCGTLLLAERLLGHVIIGLGSLLGLAVLVVHLQGAGVGGNIAKSDGAFFFIWTLLALGVSSSFTIILSLRELWRPRSDRSK